MGVGIRSRGGGTYVRGEGGPEAKEKVNSRINALKRCNRKVLNMRSRLRSSCSKIL